MKRTKFELILAAIFFITGLFLLIFSQRGATGAAVHIVDVTSITSIFVGFLLVVSSLVFIIGKYPLLFRKTTLDDRVRTELQRMATRISDFENDPENIILVVDTSLVSRYLENPRNFQKFVEQFKHVVVPESVLNEVKDSDMHKLLEAVREKFELPPKYGQYKDYTMKCLKTSPKHVAYVLLKPILEAYVNGEKEITDFSDDELKLLKEKGEQIKKWMIADGWDIEAARKAAEHMKDKLKYTCKKMLDYLKENCKVSDTDASVMATVLSEVLENHKKVALLSSDGDLRFVYDHVTQNKKLEPLMAYFDWRDPNIRVD